MGKHTGRGAIAAVLAVVGGLAGVVVAGAPAGAAIIDCGIQQVTDVPFSHPFSEDVEWMAAEEISTGYPGPPVTYRPDDAVTRQAMSAFMHRLAEGPGVGITP